MPAVVDRFVGRQSLVAQLDDVLDAAAAGRGQLVVLAGEPGIGKTRLAWECVHRAGERGFAVAWSACGEDEGAPGYWPWTQLVNTILATHDGLTSSLGAAEPLIAPSTDKGVAADPELARFALFDAVVQFLQAAARRAPALLVMDDIHWADGASLSLLAFVSRQLSTLPVVVVATCRDGETVGADVQRQLAQLPRHGAWLTVCGLVDAEVVELVAALTGHPIAQAAVGDLHRRTGGNPLFVTEIARLAMARRLDVSQVQVPGSIRAILQRRLDQLSEDHRTLLATAAVIGTRFPLDLLAAATDVAVGRALELLDEARKHGLVREDAIGAHVFTHAVVREAVYFDLGLARRVRLHELVAEKLVDRAAAGVAVDPAEIAHHFSCAAPAGRAADAVTYLRIAGDAAMGMLAHEEAARHYATTLELLDIDPAAADRADLLLALGAAQIAAGNMAEAREAHLAAADAARTAGDPEQLAAAALGLGGGTVGFEVTLFDRQQIGLLEEALEGLDDTSPLRPVLLARLSVALSLDAPVERRAQLSSKAVTLARDGDRAALAYALAAHCDAIAGPADSEARRDAATEIVALAGELGDARMELLGRRIAVVALLELGDLGGADTQINAFARLADTLRQPLFGWYVPLWRGLQALVAGRVAEASEWLAHVEGEGRQTGSDNAVMLGTVLRIWVLFETARWEELLDVWSGQADAFIENDTNTQHSWALVEALAGRLDDARQRLSRTGVDGLASVPVDAEWLPAMAQVARTIGLIGEHPTAGWLYAALLPHRERFSVEGIGAYCQGSMERFLGILAAALGEPDDARAHFEAALAANEAAGMALAVVSTLRDGAVALADPEWYHRAIDGYRALSIESQVADLTSRLEALGAPPATAPPEEPAGAVVHEGEYWRLTWAGRTVPVKDSKGMHDLALLLSRPGREVPALDLASAPGGGPSGGDLGEVIDAEARGAYQARLTELEEEIDDADRRGDPARSDRAIAERDALVEQLTAAYGLGGRARRAGDPAERARSAVSKRLRDAVSRIAEVHPDLGRHLQRAIRTGRYVAYDPEQRTHWITR